jgi:hypothetical protein
MRRSATAPGLIIREDGDWTIVSHQVSPKTLLIEQ